MVRALWTESSATPTRYEVAGFWYSVRAQTIIAPRYHAHRAWLGAQPTGPLCLMPTRRTSTVKVAVPAKKQAPPLRNVKHDPPGSGTLPHLTATSIPGVFINASGAEVDERGVKLNLSSIKRTEEELALEILGEVVDSPAKLLKRVALDPRIPMMIRIDAAKAAAPYFDRKTPVSIENKNEDFSLDAIAIAKLPVAKRRDLLEMLKTLGVDISVAKK